MGDLPREQVARPDRPCDRRHDELGIAQCLQRHPEDTLGEIVGRPGC